MTKLFNDDITSFSLRKDCRVLATGEASGRV